MNEIVSLILQKPDVETIIEETRQALIEEHQSRTEFWGWLTVDLVLSSFKKADILR